MSRVAKVVEQWKPDRSKGTFRGWLYRVARNVMLRWIEKRNRETPGSGGTGMQSLLQAHPNPDNANAVDIEYMREVFGWVAERVRHEFQPTPAPESKLLPGFQGNVIGGASEQFNASPSRGTIGPGISGEEPGESYFPSLPANGTVLPAIGGADPTKSEQAQLNALILNALQETRGTIKHQFAVKEARRFLENYFEAKMRVREQQIRELEARVETLRKQLGTRQQAREEIIDLKLKTLVNQAAGLGF
jgi:hypothetical protein